MNLPNRCKLKISIERIKKPAAVLFDVRGGIFIEPRKIQIIRRKRRDSAETRGKAVRKTRALQSVANKNLYVTAFSPMEACIG